MTTNGPAPLPTPPAIGPEPTAPLTITLIVCAGVWPAAGPAGECNVTAEATRDAAGRWVVAFKVLSPPFAGLAADPSPLAALLDFLAAA